MNTSQTADFPMRINKYVAWRGWATRRAADDLILAGRVRINGRKAVIGERVKVGDRVELVKDQSAVKNDLRYIAYYKPRGVITHSPQGKERAIADIAADFSETFPVGRLDKMSEGLIILTNDGRVTERLLHPRFQHEKEYQVTVQEKITPRVKKKLLAGTVSEGETLSAKNVAVSGPHSLVMVLTEGKKHQIRRMLESVHLTVLRLKRVRIMGVHVGALRPGEGRELTGQAKKAFLRELNLVV